VTRPIFEPTLPRTLSAQGYTNRQLLRRPAPSGCPCPVDAAVAYDSTAGGGTGTVSNNTTTDVIFDQRSFATGTAAFAPDQNLATARPFKCVLDGWYLGYINFEWSGSPYTDVRSYALYINSFADNAGDQNIVQAMSQPNINAAYNGTFGPLYIRAATLGNAYFKTKVHHQAGSTQTVTGVLMTVIYLGEDLEPGRWPPF
jgi:hypothetical protein